jgi:hypothetical protein
MESPNEEEVSLKIKARYRQYYNENKTKILARNKELYLLKKGKESSLVGKLHSNYMMLNYKILKEGEHFCLVCNKAVVGIQLQRHINASYHQKKLERYKSVANKTSTMHKVFLEEVEKYKEKEKEEQLNQL